MPVVVIWALVIMALGAMAGVTAYFLTDTFTTLLAGLAVVIILFGGLFPNLPALIQKTKNATAAFRQKFNEDSDEKPTS